MLAIRDRIFDLASATFDAILSLDEDNGWGFQWAFEFETVERVYDGQHWQPRLYAEALKITLPAPISLPGHSIHIEEPYNVDDAPNFLLYVFEHEPAYDIRITFGDWQGETLALTLHGLGDVNWDDEFGTSLPIRVECAALFQGINVWERSEERARSRLEAFYDPSRFVAQKSRIGFNYRLLLPGRSSITPR